MGIGSFLGSIAKTIGEVAMEPINGTIEIAKDTVNTVKYLAEDITSPEKGKSNEESKDENSDKEKSDDKQEPDPAFVPGSDECNERLENMKNMYILHTAVLMCSYAGRESYLVVTQSHGEFIQGIPQLNVGDCIPNVNIRNFGICRSPKNPDVQNNAKKILKDVKAENEDSALGFVDKVKNFFFKSSDDLHIDVEHPENSLVQQCAGKCDPQIFVDEWPDGQENVLIDGKPALLGRCKLNCGYDGEITLFTTGQREN